MNVIDWIGITLAGIGTIGNVSSLTLCILLKELIRLSKTKKQFIFLCIAKLAVAGEMALCIQGAGRGWGGWVGRGILTMTT